jgi:hypothetical protein
VLTKYKTNKQTNKQTKTNKQRIKSKRKQTNKQTNKQMREGHLILLALVNILYLLTDLFTLWRVSQESVNALHRGIVQLSGHFFRHTMLLPLDCTRSILQKQ